MPLKRDRYPMPDFILSALNQENLINDYQNRPPYQQNDYIGWITRAKRQETVDKRLNQMLDELRSDEKYMGMRYSKSTSQSAKTADYKVASGARLLEKSPL